MSDIQNFLEEEKNKYGKVYVDINYAIDSINEFVSKENLNKRKYVFKASVLKEYLNLLDETKIKSNKKSIFKIFDDTDKYKNDLIRYKNNNENEFNQLNNCHKCACLNCVKECKFDTCSGCRVNSKIVYCDHEKINVTGHSGFTLDLVNDNTGKVDKYQVLATIQDVQNDKRYIIIRNIKDINEKFILYYYPGISGDNYGEITDPKEFDYIVEIFNSCNLE